MSIDALFDPKSLQAYLHVLGRVSALLAFFPPGPYRGPAQAKVVLCLSLSVVLWPYQPAVATEGSIGALIASLFGDCAIGLVVGLAMAAVIEMLMFSAQIVSLQSGLSYASTVDPTSGADSTALLTLAQMAGLLLFFSLGGDRIFVKLLADSLRLSPIGATVGLPSWQPVVRFIGAMLSDGLRLAGPATALLLLTDLSLAVLGRIQSQLHLVSLTTPIKLAATLLILGATTRFHPAFVQNAVDDAVRLLEQTLSRIR